MKTRAWILAALLVGVAAPHVVAQTGNVHALREHLAGNVDQFHLTSAGREYVACVENVMERNPALTLDESIRLCPEEEETIIYNNGFTYGFAEYQTAAYIPTVRPVFYREAIRFFTR